MSQEELMLEKTKLQSLDTSSTELNGVSNILSPEEENNSLLSKSFGNSSDLKVNAVDMKFYNTDGNMLEKGEASPKLERNLYPNVLVSASREQSDIDSDEDDYQLRNCSNPRTNDSGQGSSITDNSITCNDFKKIDLHDDENSPDDDINDVDVRINQTINEEDSLSNMLATSTSKAPELDKNVKEVLSKIQEGTEVALSRSRTSSILTMKNTLSEVVSKSKFDDTDFTDIPLNSPGNKPHVNTYAPRTDLPSSDEGQNSSGDLPKPSITDAKPKSGLKYVDFCFGSFFVTLYHQFKEIWLGNPLLYVFGSHLVERWCQASSDKGVRNSKICSNMIEI